MSQLELQNCVLPDGSTNSTIGIDDGCIISMGKTGEAPQNWNPAVIDAEGALVLPGLCDVHVHDRDPGGLASEIPSTLADASRAGGVVYTVRMPNTDPPLTTIEALEGHLSRKQGCSFWFGATVDNAGEIKQLTRQSRVCGVKMYMGSSTGGLLIRNPTHQLRVFSLCASLGITLAVHAEDEDLMLENRRLLGRQPLVSDHCLIRATPVETSAVERALEMARVTGCRLHLCHISTPEGVELAHTAKERGVRVTVEVCPHHLFLDQDRCQWPNQGGFFKMNPPLRSWEQVQRLQELVLRPDFVDIIASDHAPHTKERKQGTDIDQVLSGVPGVQTILPMMMRLVHERGMSFDRLIQLTSQKPFELLGMGDRGKLQVGSRGPLILCHPERIQYVRNEDMRTHCKWTPFDGFAGYGVPVKVI